MSELDKDLSRMLGVYESAVFKKDVQALMRLYDPNVRVFDTWGLWSYEGADAWQRAVEAWFTSLGTEQVKVTFSDVQAATSKEMASLSAFVSYAGLDAGGQQLRVVHNRITWVLRTIGHVRRIVHEHSSAPIGFDDAKAILSRDGPA